MDEQTALLKEIVGLLTLIAEPHIAQRDEKLRTSLADIIGKGQLKAKAVSLMNGTRSPSTICKESGIDQGALSRLIKALREAQLLLLDDRCPALTIPLPTGFFEALEKTYA